MIQTFFNGMITILLAKFIINDLPHAAGLLGNPNTAADDSWDNVWKSCVQAAKILGKELTEQDMPANWPELRRLHKDLWAQVYSKTGRRKLGAGSPSAFRLERTTTDRVLGDFDRTWHKIESDMDLRMQSALGILKNVMGYYYEEPCVVAWDNNDLVGVAVYETSTDVNLGIQSTHIKEIASFTHKPGVGKLLIEEVIRIGREEGSDVVSASYGPGAREFYERLGFVQHGYYLEEPTLMTYRLKSSSNPAQVGTCYEDAWRFLIKQEEGYLIHGTVRLYEGGREVKHAWVELPTGWVWEPQTKSYFTLKDFEITSPIEEHRYTTEEAAIMVARVGKHGPWSAEERMKHIGR